MNLFDQAFDLVVISNFAVRPGKLFVGVDMNLSMFIGRMNKEARHRAMWSTKYIRLNDEARSSLFPCLSFVPTKVVSNDAHIRKVGFKIEEKLLEKAAKDSRIATIETRVEGEELYYKTDHRRNRHGISLALRLHRRVIGFHHQLRHQIPPGPGRGERGGMT